MTDKLITIATYTDRLESVLAQARLEEEGVKCLIQEDSTFSLFGFPAGSINLQVKESDAERALAILNAKD